jgi:hypothetical protein
VETLDLVADNTDALRKARVLRVPLVRVWAHLAAAAAAAFVAAAALLVLVP